MKTSHAIYEQELFGRTHWRAQADDGSLILGQHQVDFPSKLEAVAAVRRFIEQSGESGLIYVHSVDRQANGRRRMMDRIEVPQRHTG